MITKSINFRHSDLKEIISLLAEGRKLKVRGLQFFGCHLSQIYDAASYLIETHYESGTAINMGRLIAVITDVAKRFELHNFFWHTIHTNLNFYGGSVAFGKLTDSSERLIAIGNLDEDFDDSDNDPYETPGGYRHWKALTGASVKYFLNDDLTVRAVFPSNCIVDHYNNNVAGLSTGGGTTKYQIGQRIESRSVILGREVLDKDWTKSEFKSTVTAMDGEKALAIANELYPEWAEVLK